MGAAAVLQDWISVRGATSSVTVVQSTSEWLDASAYADVAFYLEVKDYSGSPTISYQTSPNQDEALFQDMGSVAVAATGLTQTLVRFATASVPLARFVRWKVGGTAAWSLTFRVNAVFKTV